MKKVLIISAMLGLLFGLFLAGCSEKPLAQKVIIKKTLATEKDWAMVFVYSPGKLDSDEVKKLGLSEGRLIKDTMAFCYESSRTWKYVLLSNGTKVLMDKNDRPWYKVDGGNRIYVPMEFELVLVSASEPG